MRSRRNRTGLRGRFPNWETGDATEWVAHPAQNDLRLSPLEYCEAQVSVQRTDVHSKNGREPGAQGTGLGPFPPSLGLPDAAGLGRLEPTQLSNQADCHRFFALAVCSHARHNRIMNIDLGRKVADLTVLDLQEMLNALEDGEDTDLGLTPEQIDIAKTIGQLEVREFITVLRHSVPCGMPKA